MRYELSFTKGAKQDLQDLRKSGQISVLKKIDALLVELEEHPATGTGKPKQLSGDLSGFWSRRIDQKNRIIYKIVDDVVIVEVLSLKGYYFDK